MATRLTPTVGVTPDGWVSVGVIARPHGVKGALKLHLWNGESDVLAPDLDVKVGEKVHRVASYASGIVVLDDVKDRTLAENMQGKEVFVRRDEFPDDDDLYFIDLVGVPVFHVDGKELGVVEGVSDNGAQNLLVVRTGDGREVLVPYVDEIVVDASEERVTLKPPGGLFDEDAVVDEASAADDESDESKGSA